MCSTSPSPVPPVRRGPGVVACAFYRDGQRVRVAATGQRSNFPSATRVRARGRNHRPSPLVADSRTP
jgi:hypothetical protein